MAIRSGLGAQVGAVAEATYGTFVTPTRFLEFVSEGLNFRRETIQSAGIRKGSTVQRTGRWAVNKKGATGPINFELGNKGFGLWLKHWLGAVAITTPGGGTLSRDHTHTLGDLDDLSLTIQKAFPDLTNGTMRPFSYLGCVVAEGELSLNVDGLLQFNVTVDAQDMRTSDAVATAAYPAADKLYGYQQVAILVDGGAALPRTWSMRVGHALDVERYYIRASTLKGRPVLAGRRQMAGSMTFEFEDMTQVNRFLNAAPGAEIPIVVTATGDLIEGAIPYKLAVTTPKVRFDGEMPTVQGPDLITVTAPFEVLDDSAAQPITCVYTTTDVAS